MNSFDYIEHLKDKNNSVKRRNPIKTMNEKNLVKVIMLGVVGIVGLVLMFTLVKFQTIKGNEYGILETWNGGVIAEVYQPKTHLLFPGFMKKMFIYDGASQVFVMNDKTEDKGEKGSGRELDAYLVQSQEGQDMKISLNLRWRINPRQLVSIHKTVRDDIEDKIIRPVVMRVVKDKATKMKAIDAYSGEGLVKLQAEIQDALSGKDSKETDELAERGVIVENFVIEHIELDPKYIEEIKGKQIATQKQLRAVEEQKAAEAEALVAKAKAQAEYNTKLVAQQLLATNMVIQAQADNERVIIAARAQQQQLQIEAEGQKQKLTLEAEGKQAAMEATAKGTLAMGEAEAKAKELMLNAYMAAGTNAYVQVEVAKALAEGTKSIQGYLPNNFNPTVISGNFMDAIRQIMTVSPVKP